MQGAGHQAIHGDGDGLAAVGDAAPLDAGADAKEGPAPQQDLGELAEVADLPVRRRQGGGGLGDGVDQVGATALRLAQADGDFVGQALDLLAVQGEEIVGIVEGRQGDPGGAVLPLRAGTGRTRRPGGSQGQQAQAPGQASTLRGPSGRAWRSSRRSGGGAGAELAGPQRQARDRLRCDPNTGGAVGRGDPAGGDA